MTEQTLRPIETINFHIMMYEKNYREAMFRRNSQWVDQAKNEAELTRLRQLLVQLYKEKKQVEGDTIEDDDVLLERDIFEDMLNKKQKRALMEQMKKRREREREQERDFDMDR